MGQQMLTSAASFMFKECKEVPEYFNVTDEDLKSHFPDGASIESEIAVSCFRNLKVISPPGPFVEGQGAKTNSNPPRGRIRR